MEFPSADKELTSYMLHNQEEEMKRIADELHDGVAQTMYSIYMGLQHIRNLQKDEELVQYTSKMIKLTENTLNDLRKISTDLYPQTLDNFGLFSALKSYVHHHKHTLGFQIFIKANGTEQRIALAKERAIYRVSRDMMHYLIHCPKIEAAHIMVNWLTKEFQIEMQAIGKSCCCQSVDGEDALSIASIQKQIELLSGTFEKSMHPDEGIQLRLKIPLN